MNTIHARPVIAAGAVILGDGFDPAAYTAMTDSEARRAIVRARLGSQADGKPDAYFDAAWRVLTDGPIPLAPATTLAAPAPLSDAQRVVSQAGIAAALADHKAKGGRQTADAAVGLTDAAAAYTEAAAQKAAGWAKGTPNEAAVLDAERAKAARKQGQPRRVGDAQRRQPSEAGVAHAEMTQRLADGWKR